jgi:uncharacterized protein (DUF1800 family)
MKVRARWALSVAAIAVGAGTFGLADSPARERAPLTAREKVIHVLNRLGFGPRPGQVEKVLDMGIHSWIEQQLHPERIPDPIAQWKVRDLPTLSMSTAELFEKFERPLREARRERQLRSAKDGSAKGPEAADADFEKMRDQIPPEKRPRRIVEELSASRVLAAAYSERQLNEVMVDFWMNHFNVFAAKGLDRIFITSFERDTIRPNIWGRFEDLLTATAKSPAMLFYLDNAQSTADEANRPKRRALGPWRWALGGNPVMRAQQKRAGGLNENYARELMELHTLGVDGGYAQKDVTELARVLTGWSIDRRGGEEPGAFVFRSAVHDVGTKTVLGNWFSGGGMEEGERMIHYLAVHPSTAHHIAFQLCQRLVADNPPKALVDRVAKKFLATDGDLRQTVQSIVESPEFFDPQFYRAKIKSPFEYVVSAVRAAGGDTDGRMPIVRAIAQMGEPLYLCQPPTGYSDVASAWVNTGALVARLNFALALAANRLPGTEIDLARLLKPEEAADPKRSVEALSRALTGGDLTADTRQTIEKRLENRTASADDPSANTQLPLVAGLILGSPEFQRQ